MFLDINQTKPVCLAISLTECTFLSIEPVISDFALESVNRWKILSNTPEVLTNSWSSHLEKAVDF
ncbi:hypothetical protein ACTXT7_012584 [Hymenolepis weldensis]